MRYLDLYIDFLFLKRFFEQEPADKKSVAYRNWLDFYWFLRSTHIRLFEAKTGHKIEKDEFIRQFERFENAETRNQFFEKLQLDVQNYFYSPNYDYYTAVTNPHSIFFIEFDQATTDNLEKQHGYFFVNSQNYLAKWKLLNPRNHQSFKVVSSAGEIRNWQNFQYLRHYANCLLIEDRYLLGGSYQHNLSQFLANFFHENLQHSIEVLLLIGNKINSNEREENINTPQGKNNYAKPIMNVVKQKFANPNLTIAQIFYRTTNNRNQPIRTDIALTHDRRIITNYFYFASGDSITYTNNQNEMLANTDFHVYSLFDSETFKTVQTRLREFQIAMQNVPQGNCVGDKQNRLLQS